MNSQEFLRIKITRGFFMFKIVIQLFLIFTLLQGRVLAGKGNSSDSDSYESSSDAESSSSEGKELSSSTELDDEESDVYSSSETTSLSSSSSSLEGDYNVGEDTTKTKIEAKAAIIHDEKNDSTEEVEVFIYSTKPIGKFPRKKLDQVFDFGGKNSLKLPSDVRACPHF